MFTKEELPNVLLTWSFSEEMYYRKIPTIYLAKDRNDSIGVFQTGKKLFIIATGSDDFLDWLSNLNCGIFTDFHVDIYGKAKSMGKEVEDFLLHYLQTHHVEEIILGGHSRGGLLATYIFRSLLEFWKLAGLTEKYKMYCITFGCPRSMSDSKAKQYEKLLMETKAEHLSIINGWDIVTDLPPTLNLVGDIIRFKRPFYWRLPSKKTKAHLRSEYARSLENLA